MTALILLREWQASQVEFWRPIQNFPGYDVSSFGRVRSFRKRIRTARQRGFKSAIGVDSHQIKPSRVHDGYLRVGLRDVTGKEVRFRLNRLVAGLFIPNLRGLATVNHLNGIKADNRDGNLEWASRADNEKHATMHGLKAAGERHGMALLVTRDVLDIRASDICSKKVAIEYGVSKTTIERIRARRSWKNV